MVRHPTVTIKVSGAHSDTSKPGTRELLEEFLGGAGVFGNISAVLCEPAKGRPHFQGVEGVRVTRKGDRVYVKVQPGSNDSRRVFLLVTPSGLDTDKFYNMLKKAETRLSADDSDDEESPAEDNVCATPSVAIEEDEVMRLTREGLAYIEQASGLHRKAEGLRRKIGNLEREGQELDRRNSNLDREDEDFVQRLAEIERELELIRSERVARQQMQADNKRRQAAIDDEADILRREIEAIEAEAAHLLTLRDDRQRQIEECERNRDIDGVARKLEAELQGRKPEDIAEALRRAGFDLSALLQKPT